MKKTSYDLERTPDPSIEQTLIPFCQGCPVQILIVIGHVILEKDCIKFQKCIFANPLLSPFGNPRNP